MSEPCPALPALDWEQIRSDAEAAGEELVTAGKPGTIIIEINTPKPGTKDRRPVHRVWTKMPAGKR